MCHRSRCKLTSTAKTRKVHHLIYRNVWYTPLLLLIIHSADLQSSSAFNNVLTKLFREKKFIDVEDIYKLMKRTELQDPSKGIRRDEESFMIMFKTYMKRKRVEKMINLVEDMKYGARIIPPAEAYRFESGLQSKSSTLYNLH